MAEIYSLVYRPTKDRPEDHYSRVPVEQVNLIADHGIEGDTKAGGSPERNLNIMFYEIMQALSGEGFKTQPGEMGEQVIVRGLDVNTLAAGTRLQFGDSAVIEVIKPRTGCDRFQAIQGKKPSEARDRLGVMARVVEGGSVRVGDAVLVREPVAESVAE